MGGANGRPIAASVNALAAAGRDAKGDLDAVAGQANDSIGRIAQLASAASPADRALRDLDTAIHDVGADLARILDAARDEIARLFAGHANGLDTLLRPASGNTDDLQPAATHQPAGADPRRSWRGESGLELSPDDNALVDEFLQRAAEAEPSITARMKQVAEALLDATLEGLEFRLKSPDSLKRKVATDSSWPSGMTIADRLTHVSDAMRYTICLPYPTYRVDVRRAMKVMRRLGFERAKVKNFWGSPVYQGINSTWMDPSSGMIFELQFHTPESFSAKMATHEDYEIWRRPDCSEELAEITKARMASVFATVACPDGATELGREDP